MNELISICIPTYQRPQLLKEALESCLIQQYEPIELIIGDDSKDNITENLVKELQASCKCKLRYVHNVPSLGQSKNVNMLFEMAKGERLVLLHDDDLLLPNALVDLAKCWQTHPELTAVFGKQYIISMTGKILHQESEGLNKAYYRTVEMEGLQPSAIESALLQQFPNDGYMILSSAARRTKYKRESEVGDACDYEFGIRLALAFENFYFLNQYTAKYRLTNVSVTSNARTAEYMYPIMQSLTLPESAEHARRLTLERLAPVAIKSYALQGRKKEALNIYFSEFYSSKRRFSLKGIYHRLLILSPLSKFVK